jgi:hypothetical protein
MATTRRADPVITMDTPFSVVVVFLAPPELRFLGRF